MTPLPLTVARIGELQALFAAQFAADTAALWANPDSMDPEDSALIDAADAAANAINDQVSPAEIVEALALARLGLEAGGVREKALREAAEACVVTAAAFTTGDGHHAAAWANGCDDCERAVLALIPAPPTDAKETGHV